MQILKELIVRKGEVLQRTGDLNTNVFLVKAGLLRSYSIDNQGKEHIFMFAPEEWLIADNSPKEIPCDLYIDALEDSVVLVLEKNLGEEKNQEKLIKRLGVLQKRIIMLMSSSALERYDHFLETYPQIVQRVPQKMVASYLGITPEALSRVKKERFQKK